MSDGELSAECARMLEVTAGNLRRLALIVRIKEERGQEIRHLKVGILRHLRAIARGELLPEVVAKCADCPAIIRRVSHLELPDQKKWLDGKLKLSKVNVGGATIESIARWSAEKIEVDVSLGAIIVTGNRLVISRDQLVGYVKQLPKKLFMCSACGETFGIDNPVQCSKCGSHSFERAGYESAPVAAS